MTVIMGGRGGALGLARGNVFTAGLVAAGLAFKKTTDDASALQEQMTRTDVVFGSSAEAVKAWSGTMVEAFKITQTQALEAANGFAGMLRQVGLNIPQISEMSRKLVEIAADMASFNDQDPSEMLDRLRSGLAGEVEPLRRFGVDLSEANVKAFAYRTGIARTGAVLTQSQKVLARYRIILQQTSTAQGDAARTGSNLAGQQRELRARLNELSTELGESLLPAMTLMVSAANDLLAAMGALGPVIDRVTGSAGGLAGVLKNVASSVPFLAAIPGLIDAANRRLDEQRRKEKEITKARGIHDRPEPFLLLPTFPEPTPRQRRPPTAEQRNEWFDAMIGRRIDRIQDIQSLRDQIAALREVSRLIGERIAVTKDATRKLRLEDDQLAVMRMIRADQEALAAEAKAAGEAAKQAAEEQKELARQRLENAQFAALGLGPGGRKLVPGVEALRRRLNRLTESFGGRIPANIKKKLDAIRAVIQRWGKDLTEDVRRAIEGMLATLDKGTGEKQRKMVFRAIDPDEFLRGLGLSPEQIRALRARLAGVSGGKVPTGGPSAFGMPLAGATVVQVYGDIVTPNPDAFARQMQKRAARSRSQQRGVRPGVNQGLA